MNELNPFKAEENPEQHQAMVAVEGMRAVEETRAAMTIAKQFPRDENKSMDRILNACTRPGLAEASVYAYPRGGQTIVGPSIRLAEAIAQNWGNIQFGIRELAQANGESQVESFAWDMETNTRQTKVFNVPHIRYSKKFGNKVLTDPRDIYELVANQGARRLRACILGIIPGDVIENAVRQAEITQQNNVGAPEEQIERLVKAFAELGINKEQLAKRLRKNLNAATNAEILSLKRVYASLRDGMAGNEDYFEIEQEKPKIINKTTAEKIKEKIKK